MTQLESQSPRPARRTVEPQGESSPEVDAGNAATATPSKGTGTPAEATGKSPGRPIVPARYPGQPAPGTTDVYDENYVDLNRRGSHATAHGQGFSWIVTWTILGALIPGTGLIAAGRRLLGWGLLALIGLTGVALVGVALSGNPLKDAISLAVDPQMLLLVTVAVAVVATLWAGMILLTNLQLSRNASLGTAQRVFSGVVVLALAVGVALPAYAVGQRAMAQRSLITSVFSEDGDTESGA